MALESVTGVLGYTASGSEIHAPLGSRTGRCELMRHFSVFLGAGAVRRSLIWVTRARCNHPGLFFENTIWT